MGGKKLNQGNYSKEFDSSSTVATYNLEFSSGKKRNADRGGFKQAIPLRKFFPRLSSLILPSFIILIWRSYGNETKGKGRKEERENKEENIKTDVTSRNF